VEGSWTVVAGVVKGVEAGEAWVEVVEVVIEKVVAGAQAGEVEMVAVVAEGHTSGEVAGEVRL
jgi:hypothetical protein